MPVLCFVQFCFVYTLTMCNSALLRGVGEGGMLRDGVKKRKKAVVRAKCQLSPRNRHQKTNFCVLPYR